MISSLSSSTNTISMMQGRGVQRQPPPPDKDVFQLTDTDGNGQVSETELETLVKGIEEVTGNTIDLEEAMTNFDENQDGSLNGEELLGLMTQNGFAPHEMTGNENQTGMQPPPPPPPSTEQAMASYSQNSGEDLMMQLLDRLEGSGDQEDFTSIDITL